MKALRVTPLALLLACGGAAIPGGTTAPLAARAPAAATPSVGPRAAACPATVDAKALLARHGAAFGTEAAVLAELPRTLRAEIETEGQRGATELVLDRATHRAETVVGGMYSADGVDAEGPWLVDNAGGLLRLRASEAAPVAYEGWFARRRYLSTFDPARDAAVCADTKDGPRVTLSYRMPEIGAPELTFDAASGVLVATTMASADGRRLTTAVSAWSTADAAGVRWPAATETTDTVASPVHFRLLSAEAGAGCKGVDPRITSTRDCLAPTTPPLAFEWPAGGVVRVPMRYFMNELLLRVTLAGREVWALLDTDAGLSAIDALSKAADAFKPTIEVTGSAAAQKVRAGVGELDALSIGGLTLRHLPVASIPIPAFAGMGDRRPEIIVGVSLFLGAIVRVDYAKGELVLTRGPASLRAGAIAVPFRVLDEQLVVDASFGGETAPFAIDTGSAGGFDLSLRWAKAHGFPGARLTVTYRALTGAGTEASTTQIFRLPSAGLGPIRHDERLVRVDDSPTPNVLAGLIGNQALSRCPAVTFDVGARTMWLDAPCNRPSPEALAGWRLVRKDEPTGVSPWVVESVLVGGAAEAAGVLPGDRLIDVAGKPATLDIARIDAAVSSAEGSKVPLVLVRAGERRKLVLSLARALPESR